MAEGDAAMTPPTVLWAQRTDKIYLTIDLPDCLSPEIKLYENKLHFKGQGGVNNEWHALDIEFYGEIDVAASKYTVLSRHIPMVLMRKEEGPYWPHLLSTKVKMHWLRTDFDKWKDEDDDDNEEDPNAWNMEHLMENFNPEDYKPTPEPDDEDDKTDSDDEELPDLER